MDRDSSGRRTGGGRAGGAPPPGAITPISIGLVKAQAATHLSGVPEDVASLFGKPEPYTIGPSDVVSILVYDHPELQPLAGAVISQSADPTGISPAPGFIVGAEGEVSFPYIGRIKLGGLTEIEASNVITSRITKFVQNPQVTVRIQSFRSRRAYVQGEVRTPGLQIFTDVPMTLPEAISRAGGLTPNGDRSLISITRGKRTVDVDLVALQALDVNPNQILLRDGDMVTVRSREDSKVYVMGEILRPSALLMRHGRLSLNEALGEAGGINMLTADPGQIFVIRNNGFGEPLVYHLDAKSPTALALADTFHLKARDVVYVDRVPLVQWSRIISLILPSAQIFNTTSSGVSRF